MFKIGVVADPEGRCMTEDQQFGGVADPYYDDERTAWVYQCKELAVGVLRDLSPTHTVSLSMLALSALYLGYLLNSGYGFR